MDIIEAIKERRSVRGFDGKGLTEGQRESLLQAVKESESPFGGSLTIRLRQFNLRKGYRPGTYGMIKGAGDFFLLGMGSDEKSALTAGFRFEQVVLQAWRLGLGTCWIAATFKGSNFDRGETWPEGEALKIVCPVGVAARPTVREKLTRLAFGSKNRKPFDTLFFYGDFTGALPSGNRFREPLEMMRLAPSSTNSQPWRALVENDTVHFYYKPESEWSVLDCGIGLCHFAEAEKFRGRTGGFFRNLAPAESPGKLKYLVSYKAM